MLRGLIWTLHQRRYAALAAFLALVALGCVAAGTFELHRFQEKRHDNGAIRANAHAAAVALTPALVPVTRAGGSGRPGSGAVAIRYRSVTASGKYLSDRQQYVGEQSQGGRQGFYVLTPLQTPTGVLLVVRGFLAGTSADQPPARVAPPPSGVVQVRGRLQDTQNGDDEYGRLGTAIISSVSPARQASRLRLPVYQAYVTLASAQPGTAGLRPIPAPGLSNPTGGAGELQLLSYVVQWYVFALLALLAPFLFSRAEVKDARRRYLGVDPDAEQFDALDSPRRDALPAGGRASDPGTAIVVRDSGELVRQGDEPGPKWTRAARLADRYGRSLGPGTPFEPGEPAAAAARPRGPSGPGLTSGSAVPRSADTPHRVTDDYHAQYNDYLWQLALADGPVFVEPKTDAEASTRARPTIEDQPPSPADG